MATVRFQRRIPDAVRTHDMLSRADYSDMFTGATRESITMSPEQWTRALLHEAPVRIRLILGLASLVQRKILGLRLDGHATNNLFGWRLAARGDHWFILESQSWLGQAHLLFHQDQRQVSVATLLWYKRRIGAVIWLPVSLLHRQVGLALLRYAVNAPALTARGNLVTA